MTNPSGVRKRLGVVIPSINTVVQAEFDAMRPRGVTNQLSRIFVRDRLIDNEDNLRGLTDDIQVGLMEAVDTVMTAEPHILVLGFSALALRDGIDGAKALQEQVRDRAGVGVVLAPAACHAALRKLGTVKRLGVITPYKTIGNDEVRRFLAECGYEIITLKGLDCESPFHAASISEGTLRDVVDAIDDPAIEAIVQFGANVPMARVAAIAEFWLDIPVIAMNTATYWWALRQSGIDDKVYGFGSLLEDF